MTCDLAASLEDLNRAVDANDVTTVRRLLTASSNTRWADFNCFEASLKGLFDIVDYLVTYGNCCPDRAVEGFAAGGFKDHADKAIRFGADLKLCDLTEAWNRGHHDLVNSLVAQGAPVLWEEKKIDENAVPPPDIPIDWRSSNLRLSSSDDDPPFESDHSSSAFDVRSFLARNVLPRLRSVESCQRQMDSFSSSAARPPEQKRGKKGDFAEWFKKLDLDETISAGDVIGVHDGCVTKTTEGAIFVSVVPDRAILVGNPWGECPDPRVAAQVTFIGQALVKIAIGEEDVKVGDYLLPSGRGEGLAKSWSPSAMKLDDYGLVVGRCMSSLVEEGKVRAMIAISATQNGFVGAVQRCLDAVETRLGE